MGNARMIQDPDAWVSSPGFIGGRVRRIADREACKYYANNPYYSTRQLGSRVGCFYLSVLFTQRSFISRALSEAESSFFCANPLDRSPRNPMIMV
ncbi:hypothetical protein M413DRAFT_289262 [Hebeloma cylindrosporum]|uniref:Uncharacterized protein n=1 Tax=Hebeloma cylindrosporum TaxID=76867 RepID=A0A0C3BWX8_HEBCY|nr:hypothetical protein M413DRAFT_289262 [Hebeloma cylindrosporum h7]